jgi:hypothetical protein
MYVMSVLHTWLTRSTVASLNRYGSILWSSPGWLSFGFG